MDPKTLTRRTDPATSLSAAREMVRTGKRLKQAQRVLLYVDFVPGETSAEIAEAVGMDRHAVARRLPDLAREGVVVRMPARACRITGRLGVTWCIARPAPAQTDLGL
jgi:predicted ArsR family transcriptional regulator